MNASSQIRQRVLDQLRSSDLTRDAFTCHFDLDADTPITIVSEQHSHHHFVLRHKPSELSAGRPWEASESPGPVFRGAETTRFEQFEDGVRYIPEWHRRVVEELTLAQGNSARS